MTLQIMLKAIERVRKHKAHSPTTPVTYETLIEIAKKAQDFEHNVKLTTTWDKYENVDRQGGSFSQSEIDNQGWK